MLLAPFYDPEKSYEENFEKGPFGIFADEEPKGGGVASALDAHTEPKYDFLVLK